MSGGYGRDTYFLNQFTMRSVNKVIVMGYLATDPELKTTVSGIPMTKFKIATNRDWMTAEGEKKEFADFHSVVAWRKLGENIAKNLSKGSGVYLEGRLSNYVYKDAEGKERKATEIVADNINFITYKKNKESEMINLVEVPA